MEKAGHWRPDTWIAGLLKILLHLGVLAVVILAIGFLPIIFAPINLSPLIKGIVMFGIGVVVTLIVITIPNYLWQREPLRRRGGNTGMLLFYFFLIVFGLYYTCSLLAALTRYEQSDVQESTLMTLVIFGLLVSNSVMEILRYYLSFHGRKQLSG